MPLNRFFVKAPLRPHTNVCVSDTEHHHLAHVVRLRIGEEAELVNGSGALAKATLTDLDKHLATFSITNSIETPASPPKLLLALPLMRPAKLEWVIEKGTELGADEFLLYPADRSEKTTLSPHQLERLRTLTIAALKQSGRLFLPSLTLLPHLASLFPHSASCFFGIPAADAPKLSSSQPPLLFVTGPEAGFSPDEFSLLAQHGQGVTLSPYILRAETAPLAALAIAQHSWM